MWAVVRSCTGPVPHSTMTALRLSCAPLSTHSFSNESQASAQRALDEPPGNTPSAVVNVKDGQAGGNIVLVSRNSGLRLTARHNSTPHSDQHQHTCKRNFKFSA